MRINPDAHAAGEICSHALSVISGTCIGFTICQNPPFPLGYMTGLITPMSKKFLRVCRELGHAADHISTFSHLRLDTGSLLVRESFRAAAAEMR